MKAAGICLLMSWAVLTAGEICKPVERLQAVEQSYKIKANHAMFGLLGACPPVGEQLDELLVYQITDDNLPGLHLMDERTGEFRFVPLHNFVGVVNFTYTVTDSNGRISQPTRVTICIRSDPNVPQLNVHDVTSIEGSYVPLGIEVSIAEGHDDGSSERLTVALCNCNEAFTCERDTGRCNCILTPPDGWEFADGLHRRLLTDELTNLPTTGLQNLTLKTQLYSAAQLCLDVHAVNWETATSVPLTTTSKLLITITPSPSLSRPVVPDRGTANTTHNALQLETSEGRVIRFGGLRVRDSDDMKGMYQVRVSLDKGGRLWVKQDESSDVIFFPKESDSPEWEASTDDKIYRKVDRFGNFSKTSKMHDMESTNNGKKRFSFIGSLDGINRVLSSMVYVPWCPHWPTPPNWNLPESSWMDPSNGDRLMSTDPMKPVIWPQWYPRFWYPFPRKNWSWWPRVLPPWWLNRTCSDWTSRVHVYVHEVTSETCDREKERDVINWYANIHVRARGTEPKSLIADNLFNYFPVTSRSFLLRNLYIRSKEAQFNLRFTLGVLENQLARIENTDTNEPGFTCGSVPECNEQLQKIRVHLLGDTQDVCKITIEIRMYKDDSTRLSDYMMVWAYKATPECTVFMHRDSEAAIVSSNEHITMRQGETEPLGLRYSSSIQDQTGILHTVIYAEHGMVTVTARDGLRVYMDHMGQHERIPTYLCISGPTDMVIEALGSAKFTPLKNFKGRTTVKVDYTVPFTALKETFGIDEKPSMKRVLVNIEVMPGDRPYLPLIQAPSEVCISEMDLLPLDMIRVQGRFQQDERVTLSLLVGHGHLVVEQSRINEIYGCPEQIAQYQETLCREECSFHSACPGHQLCCQQGCSRVCSEPQQIATVQSHNPHQVSIHGRISTINMVLEAENIWYLSEPCRTDEAGESVTERVIGTNIRLEVIPTRNPEGDSAYRSMLVKIKCTHPVVQPIQEEQQDWSSWSTWSAWNECQLEGGACKQEMQTRQRQLGRQRMVQERPCSCDGQQDLSNGGENWASWSAWSAWNDCQLEGGVCGQGMQTRQRQLGMQQINHERPCMICEEQQDWSAWSSWSAWNDCQLEGGACKQEMQTRQRQLGRQRMIQERPCSCDGQQDLSNGGENLASWSAWSAWNDCQLDNEGGVCGQGMQTRQRQLGMQQINHERPCMICEEQQDWSAWSSWSAWNDCQLEGGACKQEMQTRQRQLGRQRMIQERPCSCDGQQDLSNGGENLASWSAWSAWNDCQLDNEGGVCGQGMQTRQRQLGMQQINHERPCMICEEQQDWSAWSSWSAWNDCQLEGGACKQEMQTRQRQLGRQRMIQERPCSCDGQQDLSNGGENLASWSAWSAWNDCQLDNEGGVCGQGMQTRQRQLGMQQINHERPCMICGEQQDWSSWSTWSAWNECQLEAGACKQEMQTRQRQLGRQRMIQERPCSCDGQQDLSNGGENLASWSAWSAWNDCQLDNEGGVCGQGMQTRQRQLGMQQINHERPCMICGCKPTEETIVDPSPNMTGCTSDAAVKRCPAGCEVDSHHQEMRSFTCVSPGDVAKGGDGMVQRTKSTEVHGSCICSSCLTFG